MRKQWKMFLTSVLCLCMVMCFTVPTMALENGEEQIDEAAVTEEQTPSTPDEASAVGGSSNGKELTIGYGEDPQGDSQEEATPKDTNYRKGSVGVGAGSYGNGYVGAGSYGNGSVGEANGSVGVGIGVYQPIGDNVHLGGSSQYKFTEKKTLDLTNSDIVITLTKAKKKALKEKAWNEVEKNMKTMKAFFIEEEILNDDGSRGSEATASFTESFRKAMRAFVKGKANGDVQKFNELYQIGMFLIHASNWYPTAKVFKIEWNAYLKDNAAEKFNELQSKELVKQMEKKLPVTFRFRLVALEDDGSEDKEYGVDTSISFYPGGIYDEYVIQRGAFKSGAKSFPFSKVNFGAKGQFYDEIMEYMMDNLQGKYGESDRDRFISPSGDGYENWSEKFGDLAERFNLDDREDSIKSFPERHLWNRDNGELTSSDDSQTSRNWAIDDERWPGTHCLLEVCDPLSTCSVTMPGWAYSRTFNLNLNPAVTYLFNIGEDVDFVTDVKTDDSGKVTSLSKPLYTEKTKRDLDDKIVVGEEGGIYRFKLVESDITPKKLGKNKFEENKENKICDIMVNSSGEVEQIWVHDSLDEFNKFKKAVGTVNLASGIYASTSHAAFTNKFVEKSKKEKMKKVKTHKKHKAHKKTHSVDTGDSSHPGLWGVLVGAAIGALVGVLLYLRRRRQ